VPARTMVVPSRALPQFRQQIGVAALARNRRSVGRDHDDPSTNRWQLHTIAAFTPSPRDGAGWRCSLVASTRAERLVAADSATPIPDACRVAAVVGHDRRFISPSSVRRMHRIPMWP